MINFSELLISYFIAFIVTLVGCVSYYVVFVRRPIRMLLMALHASQDRKEFPEEIKIAQGPLSPLTRELNAFIKWAGEMSPDHRENQIRREITAEVSHDFKSPLTSIQGYAEMLLEKGHSIPEEEAAEYLQIILSNTRNLNRLVNDILELAKLDSRTALPKLENFPVSELASDISNKFRLKAAQRGVLFSVNVDRNAGMAYADRMMIDRALSNIVENAVYYTPSGKEVIVSFRRSSRRVLVEVRDSGIGIPPEDLPRVFDRFYRVNKDRSQRTGGTGLGLSIAKAVLDAHGSNLKLESSLGKGTVVTFQLPG